MILVTGATGFLGSELAKQLAAQGNNLVCIKRGTSVVPDILKPFTTQIKWVEADILDVFALDDALTGITQVYHCAAWVSFNPAHKKMMIKTNVEGTANLVNLCNQYGIRMVHVSSIAAIGEAKPGELISEKNHLEETPHENAYAISKYESEMEVWRGIAEGLNAVIVNPSLIIGASAGVNGSGKIFQTVYKRLKYYTPGSCGFVDVEDVAKSMILLMDSGITEQRYIVNAENWLYKDLFTETARNFKVPPPTSEAKSWMLNLAWRFSAVWGLLSGKPKGVDKISAQAASKKLNYDNAKLIKATGITFKPLSLSIKQICLALSVHSS
ncbi:NAD-dependent epimerase/dehydratase family protein [Mucilaginibacter paludis]|uniref:NAD-dependent epimerase/dehydratase n=1 Tax=Mucilaginibacter paludis DSM 18603 TaxID=714943 RepID=H1Y4K1_9SPHI|nr:NAD-dependent epimerase/dehydratase family protein [Mucilaginibacter paludis]EHQ26785.1 NAD-dependent epimerase/dehydratase [Mucilaginibacter paludis DSM 18603]